MRITVHNNLLNSSGESSENRGLGLMVSLCDAVPPVVAAGGVLLEFRILGLGPPNIKLKGFALVV